MNLLSLPVRSVGDVTILMPADICTGRMPGKLILGTIPVMIYGGAHYLVYPDKENKSLIDSIRWEMLRETTEDYDTLAMLEMAGGISWKYASIVSAFTGAESPEEFYAIRRQVLQELARSYNGIK